MVNNMQVEGYQNLRIEVASKLHGSTLLVYWYLIAKHRTDVGPREVARAIGFQSPSTALFHLEKLIDLHLVQTDGTGKYHVSKVMKVGIMHSFWSLSHFLVPKSLIYATLTTILVVLSSIFLLFHSPSWMWVALLPGVVAAIIFWYEVIIVWQLRPRFVKN